jgi:hypothetical protein
MNLSIQLSGFGEVASAWEKAPEMVIEELAAFGEGAALFMQGEIQERTPKATGNLQQSFIAQDVEKLQDGVIAQVGTSLAHAIPVELGTRPHFPPVQAIADWVKVKFGIGGPAGQSIAWAIARKIATKGTQGAHMVSRAVDAGRNEVENQFTQTAERIKLRLVEGV